MQGGGVLNAVVTVVAQHSTFLQLLRSEDQTLMRRRDAVCIFHLLLDGLDDITSTHI
jgi:hypothetical protein